MIKINYIPPITFNCQLYLLRLSFKSAKPSTQEKFLYELKSVKTWNKTISGEIKNTEYQYNRINDWIKILYRIENFGE